MTSMCHPFYLALPLSKTSFASANALPVPSPNVSRSEELALRRFDADGSGIVTAAERDLALSGWQADYDATARAFERSTGTRYRHQPGTLPTDPERLRSWATWWVALPARVHITPPQEQTAERTAKAAKLADAVASQASFVGRVLARGPRSSRGSSTPW